MRGILIVDDNPSIRYLLRVFVESKTPFTVCGEASNGTEAIENAKELQPDLVLLDLSMPLLSGGEAASIIKRTLPQVKIILFSMRAGGISKSMASALLVDLALSKPNTLLQLPD